MQSQLASWKKGFFSKVGRLTLIKSTLSGIPIYFFSLFRAPWKVCETLEKLMHDFLWDGVEEGKGKGLHLIR